MPSSAEPRSLPPCSYEKWCVPYWILRPARYHAKGQEETLLVKRCQYTSLNLTLRFTNDERRFYGLNSTSANFRRPMRSLY